MRDVAAVVSTCWSEQVTDFFPAAVGNFGNGNILLTVTETACVLLLSSAAFLLSLLYSLELCELFCTNKVGVMTLCIFQY